MELFDQFQLDLSLYNDIFDKLKKLDWITPTYNFGGKIVKGKRKVYMMGSDYEYSGTKYNGNEITPEISKVINNIEERMGLQKGYFNGVLLNYYEDGNVGISPHKDDEKELDEEAPIVVVSLGATRRFIIECKEKITLHLKHGSVLAMYPIMQRRCKHSIPYDRSVREPRISLTIRRFKEHT